LGVIQRQGSKQSIIKILGVLIGFASIMLVYPLHHDAVGYAQFLTSTAYLLLPFLGMGLSQTAVKYFAPFGQTSEDKENFIWVILVLHIIPFLIFIVLFSLFKDGLYSMLRSFDFNVTLIQENEWYIFIIAILIMLYTTFTTYTSNFGRIVIPSLINDFSYKLILPAIIIMVYIGSLSIESIPYYIIGFFVVILCMIILYMISLGAIGNSPSLQFLTRQRFKKIAKYSIFSALSGLGAVLAFRIDVVMVTGILDKANAGLYFNVLAMAMVIDIPNQAIGKIAGPIISKSWNEGDTSNIQSIYTKASINSLIVGLLVFLGIWFNLDAIFALSANPEAFIGATQVFLFLGVAKLIDALTGINTHILIYSDYYKYNLLFLLLLGGMNVACNILFIHEYGLQGAAIATLISLTIYNVIKYLFIKYSMGMSPFSLNTVKVIGIGIVVFVTLMLLPMPENDFVSIIIRSSLISVLFIGMVYISKASLDFNNMVLKFTKKMSIF